MYIAPAAMRRSPGRQHLGRRGTLPGARQPRGQVTRQTRAIAPQLASTSALDPLSMSAAAVKRCPGCCTTRLMAPAFVCDGRCFAVSQPAAASVPLATDRACSRRLTAQRSRQLGALAMAGWYQKDRTASAVCLALWRSWPTPVRPAAPQTTSSSSRCLAEDCTVRWAHGCIHSGL